MSRIAAESAGASPVQPVASPTGTVVREGDRRWQRGPAPGVDIQMLLKNKTMLVRMAPGSRIPAHHHHSDEQCLVLEGSLRTGDLVAQAGDYVHMVSGSDHADIESASGCLFLIAYS